MHSRQRKDAFGFQNSVPPLLESFAGFFPNSYFVLRDEHRENSVTFGFSKSSAFIVDMT